MSVVASTDAAINIDEPVQVASRLRTPKAATGMLSVPACCSLRHE